jgi:hypothetical protein
MVVTVQGMRRIQRSGRALVLKSFCILPRLERGGGRVGIVPRHQVCSFEGVAKFVHSFVYGSPGFANVHEEIFAGGADAVEAGFF